VSLLPIFNRAHHFTCSPRCQEGQASHCRRSGAKFVPFSHLLILWLNVMQAMTKAMARGRIRLRMPVSLSYLFPRGRTDKVTARRVVADSANSEKPRVAQDQYDPQSYEVDPDQSKRQISGLSVYTDRRSLRSRHHYYPVQQS
jgi:cell division septal protein FtsQ